LLVVLKWAVFLVLTFLLERMVEPLIPLLAPGVTAHAGRVTAY